MANDQVINFDTIKNMVPNTTQSIESTKSQFKWDTETKDIVTTYVSRSIKSTVKENNL